MATTLPRDPGDALKQLRDEHDLTQEALKEQTGVSQAIISQVETHTRRMTLDTAARIEEGLGLPFGTLMRIVREAYSGNGPSGDDPTGGALPSAESPLQLSAA